MKKRDGVWNGDSGGEGSEGGGKRLVEEHSPTGLLKCYRILECRGMETSEAFPRMFRTARLVSSPTRQNEAAASSSGGLTQHGATFAVRVGTIDGVVTHHLRAETRRDLAAWARAIVQGCHAAAASLREYTVRCTWQGKACQLVVNHEEGFSLYATGTRGVVGNGVSPGSPPTPLWKRSFDKLKMSADDGARLLWLDFGGEDGEFVRIGFRKLSETDCLRSSQFSIGEDPPNGPERIGKNNKDVVVVIVVVIDGDGDGGGDGGR
uniref:Syntrophin C-terminal PH domain-containing protein n=1 Tax=Vespula pensylvanica TaxID=30213 RepID=A0A834KR63_VESPE|nr:hypothetical protein H0235_013632 [Vespula pensylvanica]